MSDETNSEGPETAQVVSERQVIRATVWLMAAKLISHAIAFISTIVLARILVPEDFGVIALSMAVSSVTLALFDLPVTQALIALDSPTDDEFNTAWTISLIRSAIISLALLIAAHPIASAFNMPEVANVIMMLAIHPLIFGLRNPFFENFARQLNFTWDVTAEILAKITQVILSIAVAVIWQTYWAIVAGVLAGAVVSMIVTYVSARRLPRLSLRSPKRLFGYSIWLTFSGMIVRLNLESVNFIAGGRFGQGTLGQLHIGTKLSSEVSYLFLIPVMRSLFSAFSRMSEDMDRFRQAYLKAQSVTIAVGLPIGVGLGLVADPLLPLLLGAGWEQAVTIVQFYAPTVGLLVATGPVHSVGMALNQTRGILMRDIASLLTQITLLFTGLYLFGFIGFLAGYSLAAVAAAAINFVFLKKLIGISLMRQVRNFGRSLIAAAAMAGAVLTIRQVTGIPTDALGQILTVALFAMTGAVTYGLVHIFLWIASGRPDGVERTALNVTHKFAPGLSRRLAR